MRGTGGINRQRRLYTCLDWHRAWQHGRIQLPCQLLLWLFTMRENYLTFYDTFGGFGNESEVRGGRMMKKKFIINSLANNPLTNYHFDMDVFETWCTSFPRASKDVHEEISYFIR